MVSSSEFMVKESGAREELDRVCMAVYNTVGNDPTAIATNFKNELAQKMQ